MSGIESSRVSTSITTYEKIQTVQSTVQKDVVQNYEPVTGYNNDGFAKIDPNTKEGNASANIAILPEEKPVKKTPDSAVNIAQKLSTGVLIGGTSGYLASAVGTGFMTGNFKGSPMGLGLGVAIGTGTALLKTETDNEKVKVAKNVTGAALVGGGVTGVAQSVGKSLFASNGLPHAPSPSAIALGAALATGVALDNANVGDGKTANLVKNTASGALIAGGATGLATGLAKTLFSDGKIARSASPTTIALGAAVGAGIKLAHSEVDNKGLRVAKNALAGTLIGGGAAGLVTSLGKTMFADLDGPFMAESLAARGPSRTAILVAAGIGAGIAIYNTKE